MSDSARGKGIWFTSPLNGDCPEKAYFEHTFPLAQYSILKIKNKYPMDLIFMGYLKTGMFRTCYLLKSGFLLVYSARVFPVGSLNQANQPVPGISVLGVITVPPSSSTFFKSASMSSLSI